MHKSRNNNLDWFESSYGDVIDHTLHSLHIILEGIKPLPEVIVLEVELSEARA